MTTVTLRRLERSANTGPVTSQRADATTDDDDVRFWAAVDLIEDLLTQT